MAASPSSLAQAIQRYYDATWLDYRAVWLNPDNLAFHFGHHDEQHRGHHEALNNANRVLADMARINPRDRVLDAGCGVGGSSCWLADHRHAEVVGITLVESQVVRARRFAASRGLADRVSFQCADYTETPFPDASFDVVWALESLCHTPDKQAFYRETARLLKPGGRLIVAEYMRTTRSLSARQKEVVRQWLDGWTIPDLDTGDEHAKMAEASGLVDVSVRDATRHTYPSLRRLYLRACAALPLDLCLYWSGIRNDVQHGNLIASLRQFQGLRLGCWFYGILSATKM